MSRPKGTVPIWASIDTFTDPGQPWDTAASRVRPSSGEIAAGLYWPDQPILSDFANYRDYDVARRLANVDFAEVLNWIEPTADTGLATTDGNFPLAAVQGACFPSKPLFLISTTGETVYVSVNGGLTWTSSYADAGCAVKDLGASPSSVLLLRTIAGAGKIAMFRNGVSWATQTLTDCTDLRAVAYDETAGCYWAVGLTTGTSKGHAWRISDAALPTTVDATTYLSTDAAAWDWIAPGPTYKLAGRDSTIWRWVDGGAPVAMTAPDNSIVDCVWLPEDELFMTVHSGASGKVYVSADGSSWSTARSMGSGIAPRAGVLRPGAVRGSIYVLPVDAVGAPFLAYTADAGESWELVPDPTPRHTSITDTDRVRTLGGRFGCFGYKAAGVIGHALGFRAGAV